MKDKMQEYFFIEQKMFGSQQVFPFHLYIFNPVSEKFVPFLYANSPLAGDKKKLLEYILNKGGQLAVKMQQKKTFLLSLDLEEKEVPDLAYRENVQRIEEERIRKVEKLKEKKKKEGDFPFHNHFYDALETDDFSSILNNMAQEVELFPTTHSHTVSLARFLGDKFLERDTITTRTVATSYFMAKAVKIDDEPALSDLICAGFFHHIGFTQMDLSFSRKSYFDLNTNQMDHYEKHPGLAHHLIKKSQIDLSERCIKIILEHHELFNGTGYPSMKKGEHIDPLSLILGASGHLFEFSMGKITRTKTRLFSVINAIRNGNRQKGLRVEFGPQVLEYLQFLSVQMLFKEREKEKQEQMQAS